MQTCPSRCAPVILSAVVDKAHIFNLVAEVHRPYQLLGKLAGDGMVTTRSAEVVDLNVLVSVIIIRTSIFCYADTAYYNMDSSVSSR